MESTKDGNTSINRVIRMESPEKNPTPHPPPHSLVSSFEENLAVLFFHPQTAWTGPAGGRRRDAGAGASRWQRYAPLDGRGRDSRGTRTLRLAGVARTLQTLLPSSPSRRLHCWMPRLPGTKQKGERHGGKCKPGGARCALSGAPGG